MFHHRHFETTDSFLDVVREGIVLVSSHSKDLGAKELLYHYMLLNSKQWPGFTTFFVLAFFPKVIAGDKFLVFSIQLSLDLSHALPILF